jgi:hypothetical protein
VDARAVAHLDNAITGARALQVIQQKPEWVPEKDHYLGEPAKVAVRLGQVAQIIGQRTHTRRRRAIPCFRRRERF